MRPRPQVGLVWREAIGSRRPPYVRMPQVSPCCLRTDTSLSRERHPSLAFRRLGVRRSRARRFFKHLARYCQSYRLIWILALCRAILGGRAVFGRTGRGELTAHVFRSTCATGERRRPTIPATSSRRRSPTRSATRSNRPTGAASCWRSALAVLMDYWAGFLGASRPRSWGSQASATGTLNSRHDNQGYHQGCARRPLAHCRALPIGPNLNTESNDDRTYRLVRALWISNW